MTSFGCCDQGRDSVRRASMHVDASCNTGVRQFKPIFQMQGNTFRPIVFGYLIADWLLYMLEVFIQQNLVADCIRLKLNFIPKN